MNDTPSPPRPLAQMHRLLDKILVVSHAGQRRRLLDSLTQPNRPTVVSFINQHAFNISWEDEAFREHLLRSDLLLRDGVGIEACLRMQARDPGLDMAGNELIPDLFKAYGDRPVALIATADPFLTQAAEHLRRQGLNIVCALDGFGDEERYLPAIAAAQPHLILLGMGMPKQERVSIRLAEGLEHPALIVNGGGYLDLVAGRFPHPSPLALRLRVNWLKRLLLEPRRLWPRYVTGGAKFAARMLRLGLDGSPHSIRDQAPERPAAGAQTWTIPPMPTDASPLFPQTNQHILQLLQRFDHGAGQAVGRIVQFIAARHGEGVSSLAHSYATASAQLRRRKVLLLSDDIGTGDSPHCLAEAALAGVELPAPADFGVSCARLASARHGYKDNCAALGDASVWSALCEHFDEVVVDAKPPYGLVTAAQASGVVVVVEADATRAPVVRRLLDDLAAVNARVLGAVLNKRRFYVPQMIYGRL